MEKKTWLANLMSNRFIGRSTASDSQQLDCVYCKCPKCRKSIQEDVLKSNLNVCECGFHLPFSVDDRIQNIFDDGYEIIDLKIDFKNIIDFEDLKKYEDRFEEAKKKTGKNEAFTIVKGFIDSKPCIGMIMDFNFIGGSMGTAVGEAIKSSSELAIKKKIPLIIFTASGGARMQEGLYSLMQMPKSIHAVEKLKQNNLPFIAVLTHPTTGGVLAAFGMRGTLTIAEPGAIIGFTGPRVIQSIIKVKLPDQFQTPEFVKEKGFIDAVINRKDMRNYLAKALKILTPIK